MGLRISVFLLLLHEIAPKPDAGCCSEGYSHMCRLTPPPSFSPAPSTGLDTRLVKLMLLALCLLPLEEQVPSILQTHS